MEFAEGPFLFGHSSRPGARMALLKRSALTRWRTAMTAHAVKLEVIAGVPKDCIFLLEDGVWNGVCEELSVTVHGSSFEDAKTKMELSSTGSHRECPQSAFQCKSKEGCLKAWYDVCFISYFSFAYSALASFRGGARSSAREDQSAATSFGNLGCPASRPCSDLYEDR
jgi:hypothetical protein